MVYRSNLPATAETFTLSATLEGFQIESVRPAKAANLGNVTVNIEGAQFTGNTDLQLIDSTGMAIDASRVYFSDSGRIAATFDLAGAATGLADIRVVNPGNVTAELPDAFDIIDGVPGKLEAVARVPGRVRGGREFEGFIEYRNSGDTDLLIPFLSISTSGIDLLDWNRDRENASASLQLLAANPGKPAGILPARCGRKSPDFWPINRGRK